MVPRTLVVSCVLLLGEWALSLAAPAAAAALLYFHVGLFGATLVSGFWSLVTERFDPHTARRAMGLVGTGASLGGVTGGVVTWAAAAVVPVPAMLVVLALMTLFCVPMARALAPPPQVAAATPREATESGAWAGSSPGWKLLGRVPYLRDLAVLVGVCALMEALLDYTFNAAAAARYARGGALISFFALFHTAAGLLTLAVQATLARIADARAGGSRLRLLRAHARARRPLPPRVPQRARREPSPGRGAAGKRGPRRCDHEARGGERGGGGEPGPAAGPGRGDRCDRPPARRPAVRRSGDRPAGARGTR